VGEGPGQAEGDPHARDRWTADALNRYPIDGFWLGTLTRRSVQFG
jgi:hypothetical protein